MSCFDIGNDDISSAIWQGQFRHLRLLKYCLRKSGCCYIFTGLCNHRRCAVNTENLSLFPNQHRCNTDIGTRTTASMKVGIVFYIIRQFGGGHYVGNGQSTTWPEHPVGGVGLRIIRAGIRIRYDMDFGLGLFLDS